MLGSLRFRLPALFLLGVLLAGLVSTLIAIRFFQSYTRSHAIGELRAESVGIVQLYARQTGVADVPVKSLEKAFELQSDFVRGAYEAYFGQAAKVGEIVVGMAKDAYQPYETLLGKFGK